MLFAFPPQEKQQPIAPLFTLDHGNPICNIKVEFDAPHPWH
jgi:hypothetical protein